MFSFLMFLIIFEIMRTLLLALSCITFITVNAQIPKYGLVAYFPLNGNVRDSSVNQTHGTAHDVSPTADRRGNPNSAYTFKGIAGSYVEFPGTNVKNNTYTYALWAKINVIPDAGEMAFALNIGTGFSDQSINISNNYLSTNGWLGGGYNTVAPNFALNENKTLATGVWTHVICVREAKYALLFVNGVLVDSLGSSTVKTPAYGTGTVKGYIGIRNGNTTPFNGSIDDVCIYNRALSRDEVKILYWAMTSVNDISYKASNVKVYPNPGNSNFFIDLNEIGNSNQQLTVKITNAVGQNIFEQVYTAGNKILEINASLSNGLHCVSIYDENNMLISTEKIIVQP
jgi:hypothetical protein